MALERDQAGQARVSEYDMVYAESKMSSQPGFRVVPADERYLWDELRMLPELFGGMEIHARPDDARNVTVAARVGQLNLAKAVIMGAVARYREAHPDADTDADVNPLKDIARMSSCMRDELSLVHRELVMGNPDFADW